MKIIVKKKDRLLELYDRDELVKAFPIVLGSAPEGNKEIEGDGKTPEGEYYVFTKNPKSKFHLSLGLSYPALPDAERGFASGTISEDERASIADAIAKQGMPPQKTALGGEIYIHGGGTDGDWTEGCVAMDNSHIGELFKLVEVGTRVEIRP